MVDNEWKRRWDEAVARAMRGLKTGLEYSGSQRAEVMYTDEDGLMHIGILPRV